VESLINRASVILPTYYRPSSIRVAAVEGRNVTLVIDRFPELDAIIQNRIAGWIERAVEISGQRDVVVAVTKSFTVGDDCTEFAISWQ
jgi:hypothetical protein